MEILMLHINSIQEFPSAIITLNLKYLHRFESLAGKSEINSLSVDYLSYK